MGRVLIDVEKAMKVPMTAWPATATAVSRYAGGRRVRSSAVSILVLGCITALFGCNTTPAPPSEMSTSIARSVITLPPVERLAGLNSTAVALSPDGIHLILVVRAGDSRQLVLRLIDRGESALIAGTEGAESPFFSPDGQWVGFFADGKLKKVSIGGAAPLTLCDAPALQGASWGTNDTIVFAPSNRSGLFQVSAAGGTPKVLTTLDAEKGEISHRWPETLPNGNAVLFVEGTATDSRIVVLSLETGERRVLIEGGTHARYVPTGHLVYAPEGTPGTLLAVPFDPSRLEVTGSPVTIIEGVGAFEEGPAQFSFSSLGTLVYVPRGIAEEERTLVWVDRQGAEEPLGAPPRRYRNLRLSPDGLRLAVTIGRGNNQDVWIYDIARHALTQLTFEKGRDIHPIWAPDGRRLAFRSAREGSQNLFWKPADGSGAAERLTTSENGVQSPTSWSPDDQVLAFYERPAAEGSSATGLDIWVLPLEGERKPRPFLQTQFDEGGAVFSQDGRWLAYGSNESGRLEVYVQPFPGPGNKWQISTEGGAEPAWARSGRELFYRNGDQMMAVEITTEPTFSAGTPKLLFEGTFQGGGVSRANYGVTPDGQRFAMIQEGGPNEPPPQIYVVLNWFEELKRRVPTGT